MHSSQTWFKTLVTNAIHKVLKVKIKTVEITIWTPFYSLLCEALKFYIPRSFTMTIIIIKFCNFIVVEKYIATHLWCMFNGSYLGKILTRHNNRLASATSQIVNNRYGIAKDRHGRAQPLPSFCHFLALRLKIDILYKNIQPFH